MMQKTFSIRFIKMTNEGNNAGVSAPQEYRLAGDININRDERADDTSGCVQNEADFVAKQPQTLQMKADTEQNKTVSVFDVAKYVLSQLKEPCTTMKLHKLLYYCQAWHLVWEDRPLFTESIEAWSNGPVIRELFNFHQGLYWITQNQLTIGNPSKLCEIQKEDIDNVLAFYGDKTSQWLIDQTHIEDPWRKARKGLFPSERGNRVISLESMSEYYGSLK